MAISVEAGRVLGCLVEKQLTTPQQYPLTANALAAACNQSTNRQPVMDLDDETIGRALDELKALRFVRFVLPSHGKSVTRYRHAIDESFGLDDRRAALLAVLLLRGPQTPGELRARTERMASFDSVGDVINDLDALAGQPEPLVQLLGRQPGQKEDRWQQQLTVEARGSTSAEGAAAAPAGMPGGSSPSATVTGDDDHWSSSVRSDPASGLIHRIDSIEGRLVRLESAVSGLTDSLGRLRRGLGDDDEDRDEHVDRTPS